MIHAETNKSEQFNAFAHWSFFGQQGEIAENMRHEQRKLIKYNHLVANMVILYNVHEMTRVLSALREEGVEITLEILAGRRSKAYPRVPNGHDLPFSCALRRPSWPVRCGCSHAAFP